MAAVPLMVLMVAVVVDKVLVVTAVTVLLVLLVLTMVKVAEQVTAEVEEAVVVMRTLVVLLATTNPASLHVAVALVA